MEQIHKFHPAHFTRLRLPLFLPSSPPLTGGTLPARTDRCARAPWEIHGSGRRMGRLWTDRVVCASSWEKRPRNFSPFYSNSVVWGPYLAKCQSVRPAHGGRGLEVSGSAQTLSKDDYNNGPFLTVVYALSHPIIIAESFQKHHKQTAT